MLGTQFNLFQKEDTTLRPGLIVAILVRVMIGFELRGQPHSHGPRRSHVRDLTWLPPVKTVGTSQIQYNNRSY